MPAPTGRSAHFFGTWWMTRIFGIALAALAMAAPLAAQTPGVTRSNGGIMIDFQGTDMRLAVAALAEAAGLNVTYSDLPQRPINLRTTSPVPASMARTYLESILKANN